MNDQPPSYSSLFNDHRSGISYIDFVPYGVKTGFFSKAKFDSFESVVDCANEWLSHNPQWRIITCESIEFKDKDGDINPTKMSYYESGKQRTRFIRGLRLWLRIFPPGEERVQKIGYINLVPETVSQGGVFVHEKYETLDDLLLRFNNTAKSSPLPGRIITIETQGMKIKRNGLIDPDRSSWTEYGEHDTRFVYIIRIFYEVGEPLGEQIGITDFVPNVTDVGCFSSRYEDFPILFNKASQWCSSQRQSRLKICNIQSLSSKIHQGDIDTRKMSYTEHERHGTRFVRILRVAHIRLESGHHVTPHQFKYTSFVPEKLSYSKFETLEEVMKRVSDWIQRNNAQVLNMETTAVRLSSQGPDRSSNKTYYLDSGRREQYIFIIRAYMY